jgi:hypothetical protein
MSRRLAYGALDGRDTRDTSAGSARGGQVSDYQRRIGRAPTRLGVSRFPYTTTSPAMRSSSSQCSSVVESGPVSYRQRN